MESRRTKITEGSPDRREGLNRRAFLTAATGSGAVVLWQNSARPAITQAPARLDSIPVGGRLALEGGTPIRSTMLKAKLPGPQYYDDEEKRELLEVLENRSPFRLWGLDREGRQPDKCNNFEREFAQHQHTKYCVAVTSGTTALMTAMAALEVGPGDEVILPAWTFSACYDAIIAAGALPVFAEIDDSMNIDPSDLEHLITPQTKAIMVVHILGAPADMDPILDIARKRNLPVLEDCAQSVGVTYKDRPVGSMGDCGIYSFQVNKTISPGEGGAFVTSDPDRFERASRFHDHGLLRGGHAKALGRSARIPNFSSCQFRMTEFTAAVLRAQLRKLDRIVSDFRDQTTRVIDGIRDLPSIQFRKQNDPGGSLGNWVFIRTSGKDQRDRFIAAMRAENVDASPMGGSSILPIVKHVENKETLRPGWPSFTVGRGKTIQYGPSSCPRTIEVWNRYVGISMDPKFTNQDVSDIIAAVRKVYRAVVLA